MIVFGFKDYLSRAIAAESDKTRAEIDASEVGVGITGVNGTCGYLLPPSTGLPTSQPSDFAGGRPLAFSANCKLVSSLGAGEGVRLFRLIGERAIHGCVASVFDGMIIRRSHPLDHGDEDDLVGWIDPEPSSGGTVPQKRGPAVG